MYMPNPDKIKQIMDVFDEVEKSNLTVNQYFKMNKTPFSQKQYYIYKKKIKENGINGLTDKRINGNNLKLTPEIQSYIKGLIDTNRSIKSLEIENLVRKEFNLDISRNTINCYRKENNLIWVPSEKESVSKSGFGKILIALALHTGLIDKITDLLYQKIQNKKRTKMYRESSKLVKDQLSAREHGKFTSSYSKLKEVKESRFKSIDEKIDKKRFVSMNIFKLSKESLRKYVLARIELPLVTRNFSPRSVNNVIGNDLEFLSGFNYKAATLDKFTSELKYRKFQMT
jgi:transposase